MAKSKKTAALPAEELSLFCEQIGMIQKAGIPLYDGMETIAKSYENTPYQTAFSGMYQALISQSASLRDAVQDAGIFPQYLVSMIGIGELTGKLDDVLCALAKYYAWESDIRLSIKNAVLYPAILIVMLTVVIGILVARVLPVFARVFNSLGVEASAASDAAMRIGSGIGTAVLIALCVVLVLVIVVGVLLSTKKRDRVMAMLCRLLPPVARVSERLSAGRFSGVISMMLLSGNDLATAVALSKQVVTDASYRSRLAQCEALMEENVSFSDAVARCDLFEDVHEKLVHFGASSGQLDAVMAKLSDIYREETDVSIQHLVSLIEPLMVSILSVAIGGILLAIMLPLLSVLSAVA